MKAEQLLFLSSFHRWGDRYGEDKGCAQGWQEAGLGPMVDSCSCYLNLSSGGETGWVWSAWCPEDRCYSQGDRYTDRVTLGSFGLADPLLGAVCCVGRDLTCLIHCSTLVPSTVLGTQDALKTKWSSSGPVDNLSLPGNGGWGPELLVKDWDLGSQWGEKKGVEA